jgi:hypothetical protein
MSDEQSKPKPSNFAGMVWSERLGRQIAVFHRKGEEPSAALERVKRKHASPEAQKTKPVPEDANPQDEQAALEGPEEQGQLEDMSAEVAGLIED